MSAVQTDTMPTEPTRRLYVSMETPPPPVDPDIPAPDLLRNHSALGDTAAELIEGDKALLTRLLRLAKRAVQAYPNGGADYAVGDAAQFVEVAFNDVAVAIRDQAVWGARNFVLGAPPPVQPTPAQEEAIVAALPLAMSTAVVDFHLDRLARDAVREAALKIVLHGGGEAVTDYGRECLAESRATHAAFEAGEEDVSEWAAAMLARTAAYAEGKRGAELPVLPGADEGFTSCSDPRCSVCRSRSN